MTTKKSFSYSLSFLLFLTLVISSIPCAANYRSHAQSHSVRVDQPQASSLVHSSFQSTSTSSGAATQGKISTPTSSLTELQARIADVLHKPELASALVAVKVASLDSGRVLFEQNANKLLRPASNMKLYTIATAIDRLSPDYRYSTSVFAPERPDAAGIVHGSLTVYGRGDPSIAARFNNGDYFKAIDDLATKIVSAGVKRVEGDLVGDESYFTGPQYGSGWAWEDLQWWYGAEVSALTVNDNALDLFVKPGLRVGAPAVITTGPPDPLLSITNHVVTAANGTKRNLTIYRPLGAHSLELVGSIALDDKGYDGGVGISHPALLFVYLLRSSLSRRGVIVTGQSRVLPAAISKSAAGNDATTRQVEIASLQSPPLSVIAAQTLKPSQNLYTELVLRTLGKVMAPTVEGDQIETSEGAGIEVVKRFLKDAGVTPAELVLSDGSGLSRNDMITADATVRLLTYMSRHQHSDVFRDALPIAGVDGTLRNRLKGTVAENNLRAKTGSLSSAASLSGYVTSSAGERLVFSIMVNNYPEDLEPRSLCIDPIALLIASFASRS